MRKTVNIEQIDDGGHMVTFTIWNPIIEKTRVFEDGHGGDMLATVRKFLGVGEPDLSVGCEVQIDYDDQLNEVADKFASAAALFGIKVQDDGKPHDGFCIYTLRRTTEGD